MIAVALLETGWDRRGTRSDTAAAGAGPPRPSRTSIAPSSAPIRLFSRWMRTCRGVSGCEGRSSSVPASVDERAFGVAGASTAAVSARRRAVARERPARAGAGAGREALRRSRSVRPQCRRFVPAHAQPTRRSGPAPRSRSASARRSPRRGGRRGRSGGRSADDPWDSGDDYFVKVHITVCCERGHAVRLQY